MIKVQPLLQRLICEFGEHQDTIDARQVAKSAVKNLSAADLVREAELHLADRVRHMINLRPGQKQTHIAGTQPAEQLQIVAEQMDLFGCDVQAYYSINQEYKRIDACTFEELADKAMELYRKGNAARKHADELIKYIAARRLAAA